MNKIIFFVLVIIFSTILFNSQKKIKKLETQLKEKNEELIVTNNYIEQLNEKINDSQKSNKTINEEDTINDLIDKYLTKKETLKLNLSISSQKLKKELEHYRELNRFIPDQYPINNTFNISKKFSNNHKAIDLSAVVGTKVMAAAAGVVISIKNDQFLGKVIIIDHLNGFVTLYAHLSKILVKEKYFVEKGELIGFVGNTGNSKNPHLHFEIIKNGIEINPDSILAKNRNQR
jgi:murein DD-endopeptidase MepM/ murein hydrolase activator NlpD